MYSLLEYKLFKGKDSTLSTIQPFVKLMLRAYYVPDTVPNAEVIVVNKVLWLSGVYLLLVGGEQ